MSDQHDGWRISHNVQIVTVIALLANFGAIIWWGSKTDANIKAIVEWQQKHETKAAHDGQTEFNFEFAREMAALHIEFAGLKVEQRNTTKAIDRLTEIFDRWLQAMANEDMQ